MSAMRFRNLTTARAHPVAEHGISRRYREILRLGSLAVTACALSACLQSGPAVLVTAEPTAVPTAIAVAPTVTAVSSVEPAATVAVESPGSVQYEGISFSYAELAQGARGESVPAAEGEAWWVPVPQHPEITLEGYPLQGTTNAPRIIVYPVDAFAAANTEAAGRIELLRQLLQEETVEPDAGLPFLPLINATQQMHARVTFLEFQGGQGVSYLTQHGQGVGPINNQDLVYTFQGLTGDGAYYVAAILPVSHATLPASFESLSEAERQALGEDFAKYIADTTESLNAQDNAGFEPSLADLDALVQSISIQP